MVDARDAARYIISLDVNKEYFTKRLVKLNGREFYEGNARLNKILHMAQNIYIGREGKKLINADFYAYDNGGVIPDIQENYAFLIATNANTEFRVDETDQIFFHKVFVMLKDAPIEELIEIDHEDPAWEEKHMFHNRKKDQIMNSLAYADDYRDRYEAANFYIDRMII
ncbi:MAG: DUF4065 domain-containing protein [Lachnospiraceae bacterium]|nr:DUF4065 domain-containing protein [Lachnospiraceae bacterium]